MEQSRGGETMEEKSVNQNDQKHINSRLVKKQLYLNSPISRVEIARNLELTTPAVGAIVAPLIAQGFVREQTDTARPSGAGRPRLMLEYVPEAFYICGVDLGPYDTKYVLTDFCGNLIASRRSEFPIDEYGITMERLLQEIPTFLEENAAGRKILGIGVSLPGLISGFEGKIYTTFREGWTDHDLASELSNALHFPVYIENNVRAKVIASEMFDRMVQAEPFAYFSVYYGIACQMIVGDRVLYGDKAAAGEIGHMVVQRGGPICPTCGNRGCLEATAGERAVLAQCRQVMEEQKDCLLWRLCASAEELTMEMVLQAQNEDDAWVNEVLEDVIDYLGIALANTVNLISPRMVVVDGRIFQIQKNRELLLSAAERNMFLVHRTKTRVTFLPYDPCRGAKGAAAVVVKEYLSNE